LSEGNGRVPIDRWRQPGIDIGERVSNDMGTGERDPVELAHAVAIPGARLLQPVFCCPALGRR
jgi:hypothetical protein